MKMLLLNAHQQLVRLVVMLVRQQLVAFVVKQDCLHLIVLLHNLEQELAAHLILLIYQRSLFADKNCINANKKLKYIQNPTFIRWVLDYLL